MNISRADLARSIELYTLGKELRARAEKDVTSLVFTREPMLRERSDVQRVVIAFGSYDPLSYAHEQLFSKGMQEARATNGSSGKDELLIVTSVQHFDKGIDLARNSTLYDRIHAQEGFASCFGSTSLAYFNRPLFVDLADAAQAAYPAAKLHFVLGTDVFDKLVDRMSYTRFGRDPDEILEKLFEHTFIVAQRANAGRIETAQDIINKHPGLLFRAARVRPISLDGDPARLAMPIEQVSSTLIRKRRAELVPVDNLLAAGMSDFVDNRFLYLESNSIYAALVAARELAADANPDAPIRTYIDDLHERIDRMLNDPALAKATIEEYSLKRGIPLPIATTTPDATVPHTIIE